MFLTRKLLCICVMFLGIGLFGGVSAWADEAAPEEKKKPQKEYKNPFASLQKQRSANEVRLEKLIAQATPKPGTKSKRDPLQAKSVIAMNKKLALINGKIFKIYLRKLKGYTPKIMRYKKKIKELEDRIKMTSSHEKTLALITKLTETITELQGDFVAKVVSFEPIPDPLLLDPVYRDKHPWLGELNL